jgi:hypothetical protein
MVAAITQPPSHMSGTGIASTRSRLVRTLLVLVFGLMTLTTPWLPPGVWRTPKLLQSGAVNGVAAQMLLLAIQLPLFLDLSKNRATRSIRPMSAPCAR